MNHEFINKLGKIHEKIEYFYNKDSRDVIKLEGNKTFGEYRIPNVDEKLIRIFNNILNPYNYEVDNDYNLVKNENILPEPPKQLEAPKPRIEEDNIIDAEYNIVNDSNSDKEPKENVLFIPQLQQCGREIFDWNFPIKEKDFNKVMDTINRFNMNFINGDQTLFRFLNQLQPELKSKKLRLDYYDKGSLYFKFKDGHIVINDTGHVGYSDPTRGRSILFPTILGDK